MVGITIFPMHSDPDIGNIHPQSKKEVCYRPLSLQIAFIRPPNHIQFIQLSFFSNTYLFFLNFHLALAPHQKDYPQNGQNEKGQTDGPGKENGGISA